MQSVISTRKFTNYNNNCSSLTCLNKWPPNMKKDIEELNNKIIKIHHRYMYRTMCLILFFLIILMEHLQKLAIQPQNKSSKNSINIEIRNYLVSQWLGLYTSTAREAWVPSLVGELISYKLSGVAKKKLLQAEHIYQQ